MHRILDLAARQPWAVMALLLVFTVAAFLQLPNLSLRISSEELLLRGDPERDYYDQTVETFGSDDVNLLFVRDDELFDADKLAVLRDVVKRIENLSFVDRTDSLFSVQHLKTVDGYLNKDPYLHTLPTTSEQVRYIQDEARRNPFINGVLLSEDARAMAVVIYLNEERDEDVSDEVIARSLEIVLKPAASQYAEVFQIGFPYVRMVISDSLSQEQAEMVPLVVLVLVIALGLLLRNLVGAMVPMITAGLSIIWTLAFMAVSGIPLNVLTSIVPVLLVIIGSTEDIHLLSEYRFARRKGVRKSAALKLMSERLGRAVLLTFVTSYVGFASVAASDIEVLWQFAMVASTGLFFNFTITVLFIPAMLSLIGRDRNVGVRPQQRPLLIRWVDAYWKFLLPNKLWALIALAVFILIAALGTQFIHVNHNVLDNFSEDSPVRQRMNVLDRDLAGLQSFSVVMDAGIEGTFLHVRYVEELVKIQRFVTEHGIGSATTSFADYLALLNSALEEELQVRLPINDDVVNEIMLFLKYDDVAGYVSEDYSRARIVVRHPNMSSTRLQQGLDALQAFVDEEIDPGLKMHITGDSVLSARAAEAIIDGQARSILLVVGMIFLVISLLFADLKVGLLAVLPNLLPIVVLFGFMGYAGIPLNMGTTMIAAIAIGIAVDDTMHFMVRYNRELKSRRSQTAAMQRTLRGEVLPMVTTSLALAAGFSVFAASDFPPVVYFGLLSGLVVLMALLADFVLTPLMLSSIRLVTMWDMLSLRMRRDVVEKSTIFQGMRTWEIRRVIAGSEELRFADGAMIFRAGEFSSEMFMVLNGRVEVRATRPDGSQFKVESFGSGDIFGEIALLSGFERKTDAVALGETKVLVMNWEGLQDGVRFNPHASAKLCMNLATRVSRRYVQNQIVARQGAKE